MEMSPEINELATALAEARKKFGKFGKSHVAKINGPKGNYEYKYGDLNDLFDATTDGLSEFGLSISQWPDVTDEGKFVLVTVLLHKSGQWMKGRYPLALYERPQEQGSAITYAKRYTAGAAVGVAAEPDDDAKAAQEGEPKAQVPVKPVGYDEWATGLEATLAEAGREAAAEDFKSSKPEFRDYFTKHDTARYAKFKATRKQAA
jgi:hypothetical protein